MERVFGELKSLQRLDPLIDFNDETSSLELAKQWAGEFFVDLDRIDQSLEKMQKEMKKKAQNLEFEEAADLRDRIQKLKFLKLRLD
ncbi:MAG: UvrB/UvrC motif-containing protein [Bdellovibrionota bacterium]